MLAWGGSGEEFAAITLQRKERDNGVNDAGGKGDSRGDKGHETLSKETV